MDKTVRVLILVLVAIAVIVGSIAWVFNPLVGARNDMHKAWSDVEAQLTKRAELTPQLVAGVQGRATHTADVCDAVAKAREQALGVIGPRGADAADRALELPLKRLLELVEANPELKADSDLTVLRLSLTMIEADLAAARSFYNGHVGRYEDLRQSLPRGLVSAALGFDKESSFRPDLAGTDPRRIDPAPSP